MWRSVQPRLRCHLASRTKFPYLNPNFYIVVKTGTVKNRDISWSPQASWIQLGIGIPGDRPDFLAKVGGLPPQRAAGGDTKGGPGSEANISAPLRVTAPEIFMFIADDVRYEICWPTSGYEVSFSIQKSPKSRKHLATSWPPMNQIDSSFGDRRSFLCYFEWEKKNWGSSLIPNFKIFLKFLEKRKNRYLGNRSPY